MGFSQHNEEEIFGLNSGKSQGDFILERLTELIELYKLAPSLPWELTPTVHKEELSRYIVARDEHGNKTTLGIVELFKGSLHTTVAGGGRPEDFFNYIEKSVNTTIVAAVALAELQNIVGSLFNVSTEVVSKSLEVTEKIIEVLKSPEFKEKEITNEAIDKMLEGRQNMVEISEELRKIGEEIDREYGQSTFISVWYERNQLLKLMNRYMHLFMDLEGHVIRQGEKETTVTTDAYKNALRGFYDTMTVVHQLPAWLRMLD